MADHAPAVLGDDRVECVAGFHVGQVRPRAEDLESAQLPPVLVGHDVVGVVVPRAEVLEGTDYPPRQPSCRDRAIRSIWRTIGSSQDVIEIRSRHLARLARRDEFDRDVIGNRQVVGTQFDDEVLDLPVPKRPEDLVGHEDGGGFGLGVAGLIEAHEPGLSVRVRRRETRREACRFGAGNRPFAGRWRRSFDRPRTASSI